MLCAVLCAAMLFGTLPLVASADTADGAAETAALDPVAEALAGTAEDSAEGVVNVAAKDPPSGELSLFRRVLDSFFRNFGFIGFIYDPYQNTIINQKPVFQWGLGFNEIYDLFPWVVNVWADTLRCPFTYGGRDWMIQLWKGGYGLFLATGGEIGVYVKPQGSAIKHYNAPASQSDWLNLEYTIYNRGKKLFTRPSPYLTGDTGPYWWCPGYKVLSICTDFLLSPRKNVVMDATIELKDNTMAQLFFGQLAKKGFKPLAEGVPMGIQTPETYRLLPDGKSVRFIWRGVNEGWF